MWLTEETTDGLGDPAEQAAADHRAWRSPHRTLLRRADELPVALEWARGYVRAWRGILQRELDAQRHLIRAREHLTKALEGALTDSERAPIEETLRLIPEPRRTVFRQERYPKHEVLDAEGNPALNDKGELRIEPDDLWDEWNFVMTSTPLTSRKASSDQQWLVLADMVFEVHELAEELSPMEYAHDREAATKRVRDRLALLAPILPP